MVDDGLPVNKNVSVNKNMVRIELLTQSTKSCPYESNFFLLPFAGHLTPPTPLTVVSLMT